MGKKAKQTEIAKRSMYGNKLQKIETDCTWCYQLNLSEFLKGFQFLLFIMIEKSPCLICKLLPAKRRLLLDQLQIDKVNDYLEYLEYCNLKGPQKIYDTGLCNWHSLLDSAVIFWENYWLSQKCMRQITTLSSSKASNNSKISAAMATYSRRSVDSWSRVMEPRGSIQRPRIMISIRPISQNFFSSSWPTMNCIKENY